MSINANEFCFQTADKIKFIARRNESSDLEVFNQVWGRQEYAKATEIAKANIANGAQMKIIDAGANVGYTSLFFHDDLPASLIYAIEPDEDNFLMLKKNIALNNAQNIVPLKFGLWDHSCNLKVDRAYRDGREWSIQVMETDEETGLRGIDIHDLLNKFHIKEIDLLKIDIEGAESYLFRDVNYANSFLSKTKLLAIEIHDENVSRDFICQTLKENNFLHFDFNDLTIAYRN